MKSWIELGISIPFGRTGGNVKTLCPKCHGTRKNKRDKSLSVNIDTGLFNCHYCGFSGTTKEKKEFAKMEKVYKRPKWNNKTNLSDKLVKWFESRFISQSTLEKLRITEGIEYMPQKNGKCNTVQFNYFLGDDLVNIKYRTGDKCFKLASGAELILYNINSLVGETECIITEGEIDALSFIECGFKAVVSVPNGANSTEYLDNYIEDYFDDKETIYIAVDTDRKGIELRNELIRRLGAERCKIVSYSQECKDANEHLIKHGKESLKITIANAEDIKIEGIFSLSDIRQQTDLLFRKGLAAGYTTGHYHFDSLLSFETGRLCVVTGIPGHGKSEFVDEIIVRLNLRYGLKFGLFTPENHPLSYHVSKLVSKFTGKPFEESVLKPSEYEQACSHIDDNFFYICPEDNFKVETIIGKAEYLVKKRGINGLVIDPYNTIEHQLSQGISETNYISVLLEKLVKLARACNILIILVAHPRKMENRSGKMDIPNLYDINGSANFFNKADFGFTVYRDRSTNIVQIVVHKVKFKHLGKTGTSNFSYDIETGRYTPNWGQSKIVFDKKNYLDDIYNNIQSSIDFSSKVFDEKSSQQIFNFHSSKTNDELEKEFLSDVTPSDQLPF